MNSFQGGSEWRRWDLHIHTPFTRKNDCFTGCSDPSKTEEERTSEKWANFFKSILDYIGNMDDPLKAIYAIGVTDYFSIENYKMVIANNDISAKIPLILPNIELRILPAAKETPIKGVQLRDLRKQEFLTDSLQAEARKQRLHRRINPLVQSFFLKG